ncbi:MAG: hypothetical protein IJW56_07310 [Bacteroides sp.]|nr:hypothetical protein [Bacteroides sp.]
MKKFWYKMALMAVTLGTVTACSDDDEPELIIEPDPVPTETIGAYILNTGNWGGNDASIQYLDIATGTVSADLYAKANNNALGDLGQDLCLYGSKLYVTVSGSSKIEILDKNCKVLKSISLTNDEGQPITPRYMTAANGAVFFTAYDGCVSRLDTLSMSITGKVAVGSHPEAITNANGKLYVNNSNYKQDGSGKTVSVIDIASFSKIKEIEVALNPYTQCLTGDDGYVYTVSNGNYAGNDKLPEEQWVYQTLQRIDTKTDTMTPLCNATFVANHGNKMYILYNEYYLPDTHKAVIFDLEKGTETPFIDINTLKSPNAMSVDPITGDVYIADSPWGSNADILVYDANGNFKKKYAAGYYTSKLIFETK